MSVELCYCTLIENDRGEMSFDKQTVQYVYHNTPKIMKIIKDKCYKNGIRYCEYDTILSDLVIKLAKAEDYNIGAACKPDGSIIPIENYISTNVEYCVLMLQKELAKDYKRNISLDIDLGDEDGSLTLGDTICTKDNSIDNTTVRIKDCLDDMGYIRVVHDIDIYLILYLSFQLSYNKNIYIKALEVCGMDSSLRVEKLLNKFKELYDIMKCCEIYGIDRVCRETRNYVYCADTIDKVIKTVKEMETEEV